MSRRITMQAVLAAAACVVLTGCMPKMTIDEMKAQMPKRPAELDRLDMLVGTWEMEGEVQFAMLDQPLKISGRTESKWEGDGWYLVSRSKMKMEHFDEAQSIETYTYDIRAKKYRSTWADSMGMMGVGQSTYNEKTRTWCWRSTNHTPWGQSCMEGKMRFLDDNTAEWSFTESMGLSKTMQMTGKSKRVQ